MLQTQCFQKLTLSIPSWLNLKKETLYTQEDCKKWSFSLSCYNICRFQGVYDICFKSFAVPSHRACSTLEHLFPEGCRMLTRGKWLPHSPKDAGRWRDGAWEHIHCSQAHLTDVFCALPGELHVSDTALIHVLHAPEHSLLLLMSLQHILWENPDINI